MFQILHKLGFSIALIALCIGTAYIACAQTLDIDPENGTGGCRDKPRPGAFIQLFGGNGESLIASTASPASRGFSFLGYFSTNGQAIISQALISPGDTPAGPNDNNGSSDIVFADDLFYGEPGINPTIYRDGFE